MHDRSFLMYSKFTPLRLLSTQTQTQTQCDVFHQQFEKETLFHEQR